MLNQAFEFIQICEKEKIINHLPKAFMKRKQNANIGNCRITPESFT